MVQFEPDDAEIAPHRLDSVRILLIGDPGVGKSSLIYALVNDELHPKVPAKMEDIFIPAQITPENVPLQIIDYSEQVQIHEELRESISDADVICIVFIAGDDNSLDRVTTHWLPIVHKCQSDFARSYKPVILVANKDDLLEREKSLDRITAVLHEFLEVEAYIEASAVTQKNVVEIFSSAQKAVIYPLEPLFDPQLRILTKKCRSALIEIFKLCDHDKDGLLSDHEINLFQENCFGTPLQKDALDDLKSIIKQSTMDGIRENNVTQTGFLFLHTLSIDKGRHDFTWQVLRKFNYDNDINAKVVNSESQDLVDDIVADLSQKASIASSRDEVTIRSINSGSDISDDEDENVSIISRLNMSWLREHSRMIKLGLGFTLVTLMSMLALKYLTSTNRRGFH